MPKASASAYHSTPRRLWFARASGLLMFFFPGVGHAQNSPTHAPANSAPAAVATSVPPADSSQKPASPAKPKHVITNEDLEPHSPGGANTKGGEFVPGESPLFSCDDSCEQAARNELGYDSDNEAEWRTQVVPARRELLEDTSWRGMLSQAIQQSTQYCNFLLQQSQQTAPSGDDYRSRTQRARNSEYFQNMDRALRQNLQTTMNRMQEHMKEVQVLSPVRAGMMHAQATRIFERTCDSPGTR